MYNFSSSSPTLTNVTFSDNSAFTGGGMWNGASSSPTLTNVTFSGNSAGFSGGGMYNTSSSPTLTNVTFSGNSAVVFGGGMYNAFSSPALSNCILFGDSGGEFRNDKGSATVNYSDVQGGYSGTGNINQDPLLAPLGDYGGPTQTMPLLPGSPAIDAGTATGAPATDQRGVGRVGAVDMGAFESRGFTLAITGGNHQQALVNTTFATPLRVQVTSSYGEPVQGGVVTFSAPGSGAGATLSTPLRLDAAGQTSVSATASGTAGSYAVSAAANGATPSQSFDLSNLPAITVSPAALPDGTYATAYSQTLTATGGAGGPFTFAVTAGTPPAGLNLASDGTLTGTPTAAGSFTFTVTATDSGGYTDREIFTVNIAKADLYVTATANSKTYGQTANDTGMLSGVVNNDGISATFSSAGDAATAPAGTGSYTITATLADPNNKLANYTVHETDAMLTVNRAPISYTIGNASQIYGSPANLAAILPGSFSTGINGETLSIAYFSSGDTATANVGQYDITGTVSDGTGANAGKLSNYQVTLNNGTLTVNKASTLSGHVFIDLDNNDSQNGNERGFAAHKWLYLYVKSGNVWLFKAQTLTDATGFYQFGGLGAGTYRITCSVPSGFRIGRTSVGTVNSVIDGTAFPDDIRNIVLGTSQSGMNYNFAFRPTITNFA
jgi:hypothetical protein